MADSPSFLIDEIRKKIDILAKQRDKASERCRQLADNVEALNADKVEIQQRLDNALLEVEFLTLSHRLADSPQALADARRKISGLIRKIDAAIALIKTDPANL